MDRPAGPDDQPVSADVAALVADAHARLAAAEARCRDLETELERARRVEAAGRALQATIDDLEHAQSLDELVPRALGFAVEAFGAKACMYFEHEDDGLIFLRSVYRDGRVLTTPDWPAVDTEQARFIALLFGGFRVGVDHLGVDPVQRNASAVLDHRNATAWPEAHRFAVSMGWAVELNVPLVVNDAARGALAIYRDHPSTFSAQDIAVAEALARQVAVAMQTARVAQHARQMDLAREREAAAAARLAEQRRISDALQQLTEALSTLERLEDWMPRVFQVAAEAFAISEAAYWEHPGDTVHLRLWLTRGQVFGPSHVDARLGRVQAFVQSLIDGFTLPPHYLGHDVHDNKSAVVVHHRSAKAVPRLHAFATRLGHGWALKVPLLIKGRAEAHLALYRPDSHPFTQKDVVVAEGMAKLVGVGIEAGRAAQRARELAVVQERSRVAADIHDSLAQSFTSIALQCEVLGSQLPDGSAEHRTAKLIERTARRGLAEARASVQALRALPEGDDALRDALAELAEHCNVRGSMTCRFEMRPGRCPLGPSAQEAVLRVAQEAANNAMRHAQCTALRLHLDWDAAEVVLTVQDNGRGLTGGGYAHGAAVSRSGGYGIAGMAERAERAGGRCTVESEPGRGVKVTLRLPSTP